MKARYLRASKINGASYSQKQRLVDISLIPMITGGIMLLLLKRLEGKMKIQNNDYTVGV